VRSWLLIAAVLSAPTFAQAPPPASLKYRADLVRSARLVWGMDAPIAVMAAQVQQESGWQANARSPYAHGLAQFTPVTADWIAGMDDALAGADTGNAVWSLRALARYDYWLHGRVPASENACAHWRDILRAYNGGLGYVIKEARSGQPCSALRSAASCSENLAYPQRILIKHQPRYLAWGPGVRCA
jgi:hypothetical protein